MSNPIGEVKFLPQIEELVNSLAAEWKDKVLAETGEVKWWHFWRKGASLHTAAMYVISSVDQLVDCVEGIITGGSDKKATVMYAVGLLYDYVVKECMPIYLKPFAGKLKRFVIDVIISNAIDWIVSKYRAGVWEQEPVAVPVPDVEPVDPPVEPPEPPVDPAEPVDPEAPAE